MLVAHLFFTAAALLFFISGDTAKDMPFRVSLMTLMFLNVYAPSEGWPLDTLCAVDVVALLVVSPYVAPNLRLAHKWLPGLYPVAAVFGMLLYGRL